MRHVGVTEETLIIVMLASILHSLAYKMSRACSGTEAVTAKITTFRFYELW